MHLLIVALGTAGDVHPMVGVALRMRARGHRVTVIANDMFAQHVAQQGLEFAPLGRKADFEQVLSHPLAWHWRCSWQTIVQGMIVPSLRTIHKAIRERFVPGETVVAASTLAIGARIARDSLGVPLASLHISPTGLRSNEQPAKLHSLFFPQAPKPLVRLQHWLADTLTVNGSLAGPVNGYRAELGLPAVRQFYGDWLHSPDMNICLFPAWYAPAAPDWPQPTSMTGFPLYDAGEAWEPDEKLAAFIEHGPAPIVFTPGSGVLNMPSYFTAAVEACRRLDSRGLLLTKYPKQLPASLPANVAHATYAPFSWILPRARGIVHHGGAGTTAQALAAGIPQLITPMAYDQPDHAYRVKQLGVGDELSLCRVSGLTLAAKLSRLLSSTEVAWNCLKTAARLVGVDPLGEVCQQLERLAPAALRTAA